MGKVLNVGKYRASGILIKADAQFPSHRYTHWKQTVFYLKDTLTVKQGEEIKGEFTIHQNKRNKRDLDLSLKYEFEGEVMSSSGDNNYKMR